MIILWIGLRTNEQYCNTITFKSNVCMLSFHTTLSSIFEQAMKESISLGVISLSAASWSTSSKLQIPEIFLKAA